MSDLSHLQWPQQGQEAGPGIGMGVAKGWSSQDNNMDTQGPGKGMGVDLGTATGPIGKSSKDTKGASKGMCVDMGPDVASSEGKHRDGKGQGRKTDETTADYHKRQRQAQIAKHAKQGPAPESEYHVPWGHILSTGVPRI